MEKVKTNKKIELVLNAKIKKVYGDNLGVAGVVTIDNDGNERDIPVPGVFVFVGMNVNNSVLKQDDGSYLCALNERGEVIVDLSMHTSVEGLYAAGDIRVQAPKQVVCAAGDGATAALQAISYIDKS